MCAVRRTGEEIPPFSVAYKEGLLGNEDDDYYMDELENLSDFQEAFVKVRSIACTFN